MCINATYLSTTILHNNDSWKSDTLYMYEMSTFRNKNMMASGTQDWARYLRNARLNEILNLCLSEEAETSIVKVFHTLHVSTDLISKIILKPGNNSNI